MYRKKPPRFLAVIFFLLVAAASLHAGGAKDTVLLQADTLIENKEYDAAIQVLTDYIKVNPEKFDDAQKRLQKIVKFREEYNTVADELLDTLVNEPDNNEKILNLTARLTAIESATSPSTQRFLNQVRELAAFGHNRNRLEQILVQARAELAQGNYLGALETYASGLDIYQAEYFASGFGEEAEAVVVNGLEAVTGGIQDFGSLIASFTQEAGAMQNLGGGNSGGTAVLADARRAYSALAPRMEEISLVMGSLANVGNSFESQLAVLQGEYEGLGDRSFLSFANRLIRGPEGQNEGMLGTLDRFWKQNIDPAQDTVFVLAENAYNLAQTAAANRNYSEALPLLDDAEGFANLSLDFINTWLPFYEPAGLPVQTMYDQPVVLPMAENYLKFHSIERAVSFVREAENIGAREADVVSGTISTLPSWRRGILEASAAITLEENNRGAFNTMGRELAVIESSINAEIETINMYREDPAGLPLLYMNQARNIVMDLESHIEDQEYQAIVRRYTISTEDLSNEVAVRETEFNAANTQIEGVQQNTESGEAFIAHYLAEGLEALTQMSQKVSVNLTAGRSLLDLYAAEPQDLTAAGEVGGLYTNTQALVNRILALQSRSGTVMAAARTQIGRANALRLEGERLYQEAQAALTRNNFETARERLQMATVRYHDSLAIQESAALRTSWDTRLIALGAEIVRLENEIVVRDVRNLVNNARTNYYAGNLEQAEDQLVRAQNRWSVTNSTREPEVDYWLNLVRGALSLQSGRSIPQTAPLYAEMSQLLSDAKRNYDEGVRLLNNNQRARGLDRFAEARQKTRDVRLMFPMNQEARLLELRIDQQTDLAVFNASFRQRLNEAVSGTKPAVRSVQSFAELQDLVQINPNYPGIRQLLTQAEIDMGYRPPPPDPRAIARSNELTQLAMVIINSRNSTQYEVALAQLTEAIQLNPTNEVAQRGKDQVQTWMTGTGTIVLDSHSQDEYTRAVQEFTRGNNLTALAIVNQLLQKSENQKSTLILELQRRIESVL